MSLRKHSSHLNAGQGTIAPMRLWIAARKDQLRSLLTASRAIIRHLAGKLWHGSARWEWYGVLFIGWLALLAIAEYAVASVMLGLAALSVISRIWHSRG